MFKNKTFSASTEASQPQKLQYHVTKPFISKSRCIINNFLSKLDIVLFMLKSKLVQEFICKLVKF